MLSMPLIGYTEHDGKWDSRRCMQWLCKFNDDAHEPARAPSCSEVCMYYIRSTYWLSYAFAR